MCKCISCCEYRDSNSDNPPFRHEDGICQIDRDQYEKELKDRQQKHLDAIQQNQNRFWRPCLHNACTQCHGTGIKLDGSNCIHMISCPCPKCTPMCLG